MDLLIVIFSSVVIPIVVLAFVLILKSRVLHKHQEEYKHLQSIIQERENVQTTMEKIIETKNNTIKNLKSLIYERFN